MLAANQLSVPLSPSRLVQDYFTAFASHDIDGAIRLMTPDVVWHIDGAVNVSTVGLLRGREQVRGWLESFPRNFKPLVFKITQLIESGNTVIALGYFRHTVLSTGHTISSDLVIQFSIRDGQIARYQIFEDSGALSRAFTPAINWGEKQIRLNDTLYAYTDRGEGPVILFAHGLFVDRTIFDAQVAVLEKNYRCIVLDMPGHGASGYRQDGWMLEDIADDLALMIQELSLGPVVFVGQSQGGMVGIHLAVHHRALLSHLILIGTSARAEYSERIENWKKLRHSLLQGTEAEREQACQEMQMRLNSPQWLASEAEQAAKERAIMLSHDRAGITLALDAAVINRRDIRGHLPDINVPTLVISGNEDKATPPELSDEIAARIPAASVNFIPGVGHQPPLEAPQETLLAIKAFLEKPAPSL